MTQGLTPLWIAVQWGRRAVVESLIAAQARVFYQRPNELFPLYVAIQNGFSDIALILLSAMQVQEANTARVDGITAVHEAIENRLWEVATALIHKGVSVQIARKNDGFTPFHSAVIYGQVALIQLMLQKGADINRPAVFGNTPLHIAARTGDTATIALLQQHHAHEHTQNSAGETPLMVAITASHREAARLLAASASLDQRDTQGRSACLLALQHGLPEIFDQLLARGEDPFTRSDGLDVLYHLISHGDYFRVQRLLEKPSLIHTTYHGRDFIDIAAQFGHFAMVDLLRRKRGASSPSATDTSLLPYIVQYNEVALLHTYLPLSPTHILPLALIAAEKIQPRVFKNFITAAPQHASTKQHRAIP
jgi:FOG: Ankyrin repeat